MEIGFKWLEKEHLDASKIRPHLPPMHNVVLQFGYDIENKEVKAAFKDENLVPPWYSRCGWSEEAEKTFWEMLKKAYSKNRKEAAKWTREGIYYPLPKKMDFSFILDGPTSDKEYWQKNKRKYEAEKNG